MSEVCVLGSLNVDFVAYCLEDTLPQPGQTVLGTLFEKNYGGKGANQAVQVARLGVSVAMCGKVGPDSFGKEYMEHLKEEGVNIEHVEKATDKATDVSTGIAQITVSSAGENCIVIVPGANDEVGVDYVEMALMRAIDPVETKVLLLQNEIPMEASLAAIQIAKRRNSSILCVYNPAPAPTDAGSLYSALKGKDIDIICPNETELASLTNMPTENEGEVEDAARSLLNGCQAKAVVVTRGSKGAYVLTDGDCLFFPADKVVATDTTGAGDSFIGTLAAQLSRGQDLEMSVKCALVCASMSVVDQGAQVSYKYVDDLRTIYRPPPKK
eukprot:GSChrysophyteH1.ASY1.ANO1.342.1 assembled CDS